MTAERIHAELEESIAAGKSGRTNSGERLVLRFDPDRVRDIAAARRACEKSVSIAEETVFDFVTRVQFLSDQAER